MESMTPWKTLAAATSVNSTAEGWNLAESPEDGSDELRTFAVYVTFETPFVYTPVVQLSLTGFDIDQRDSVRVRLLAEDINPWGFTVTISTWRDTRVYAVDFNWFAIGS